GHRVSFFESVVRDHSKDHAVAASSSTPGTNSTTALHHYRGLNWALRTDSTGDKKLSQIAATLFIRRSDIANRQKSATVASTPSNRSDPSMPPRFSMHEMLPRAVAEGPDTSVIPTLHINGLFPVSSQLRAMDVDPRGLCSDAGVHPVKSDY
ncbi:hypothetical protein, partial [Aeromicrobium halocynthiae]|uniref:hypothetical protein n=1 Tax=Aeromicrobium halocynthiae TaxID=560557 RepID=UPI0031E25A04